MQLVLHDSGRRPHALLHQAVPVCVGVSRVLLQALQVVRDAPLNGIVDARWPGVVLLLYHKEPFFR